MSGSFVSARTRPVVAGLGVLALAAAACGGASTASTKPSGNQSPTTTAPTPPGAFGSVAAISGSSLEVQNPTSGQVTVNVTPTTTFTQAVSGAATDLAPGVCATANAGQGASITPGQPFTARTVSITQPGPNGCTFGAFGGLRGANSGGGGRSTTTAPGKNRNRNNLGRRLNGTFGKVASVSLPTFVVQSINRNAANMTTTVTTDSSTTFTKVVSAGQSNLAVGQCVAAVGPADQTGAVTANSISIRPPGPNGCSIGFRGGRGGAGGGSGASGGM